LFGDIIFERFEAKLKKIAKAKPMSHLSKNSILLWASVAVICGFVIWTATGRPRYGPFNNMGFDSSWDCPPNAKPSATVCVKRPSFPN
jgi:hypothetical protein